MPLLPSEKRRTFLGYRRSGTRGSGTRNFIVVIGTTAATSGIVRAIEARAKELRLHEAGPSLDGIVAIAHTEAGGPDRPNNFSLLLRTLAGFAVHANVAAVVIADFGHESLTGEVLREYMVDNRFELDCVPHTFLSLTGQWEKDMDLGIGAIRRHLPEVLAMVRCVAARVQPR